MNGIGCRAIEGLLSPIMINSRPGEISGCDPLGGFNRFEVDRLEFYCVGNLDAVNLLGIKGVVIPHDWYGGRLASLPVGRLVLLPEYDHG